MYKWKRMPFGRYWLNNEEQIRLELQIEFYFNQLIIERTHHDK